MHEANLAAVFIRPLNRAGARFVVSGSVAAILYGEPRLTHDVDLILFLQAAEAAKLVEAFNSPEFYCPPREIIAFEAGREQRGHTNIIHIDSGFKADIYFAGKDPLHVYALQNARKLDWEGESVLFAPPEYVMIRKLEFYREGGSDKHLRDLAGMMKTTGPQLKLAELEQMIRERGLEEIWRLVAKE